MLVFASSVVFIVERDAQPDVFSSIPAAMWRALAALTTVGFGDITPITPLGKIFGGLTMLMGLGMLALPTGVIATGFAQEIRRRDFVVNWRLVSKVPLFAKLDAAQIAEIVQILTPLVVPTNHAVVRLGEDADSMFFIVSGRVKVDVRPKPIVLEAGEFFGEVGLLENRPRIASAISLADCQILELKAEDLWHLLERHPELKGDLHDIMARRLRQINRSTNDVDKI